jgi:hypothetical protein
MNSTFLRAHFLAALTGGLLLIAPASWAGYSGRLQFNHARPGGGATSGYNTEATKTVIGNLIWYRNVYQSNPSNTGTQPQAYEWDNWYWKFGPRRGGGGETDFLNANNNVQIMSTIDSGNGSDNTPDPQHIWVDVQNSKSYVFNLTDNNNGSLEPSRGYDVATFSVIEVNHQGTLASFKNAGDESRSGNTVTLHLSNNTEQASSTEELWVQWTHNSFSTKNFVEISDLSSADRTLAIPLSASAPILREGDTLQWLAVLTSDTDTSTVSTTYGSVLGFDAAAIYRNNGSGVNSYTVADDDASGPSMSGFVVNGGANVTDAQIVNGGYSITGLVQDTGSGVNVNGTTTSRQRLLAQPRHPEQRGQFADRHRQRVLQPAVRRRRHLVGRVHRHRQRARRRRRRRIDHGRPRHLQGAGLDHGQR